MAAMFSAERANQKRRLMHAISHIEKNEKKA